MGIASPASFSVRERDVGEYCGDVAVSRVLVVDGDGELVGILSTLNIDALADGRLTTREYVFNHDAEFAGER